MHKTILLKIFFWNIDFISRRHNFKYSLQWRSQKFFNNRSSRERRQLSKISNELKVPI